ncbi:glycosyltransferase family 2 protein [Hydrogenimonas sp.]
MADTFFCLDRRYSTTRRCFKEPPPIEPYPDETFETKMSIPKSPKRQGSGGLREAGFFKRSCEALPLVTIITVVYNGAEHIEESVLSVIEQDYDNIEYIVVDGGSTDGTLDIVKTYEDRIDYWVSEPDRGIYDAMNKGLMLASGRYIGFLNADDIFYPGSLSSLLGRLIETGRDYSLGAVRKVPSNVVVEPIYPLEPNRIYFGMIYPHVGALIALDLYKRVGLFNTAYRICADYDMALRIHLSGYRACRVDRVVAQIREGGVSDSWRTKRENLAIAISHGMKRERAYFGFFTSLCKEALSRILPMPIKRMVWKIKKSRYRSEN